MNIHCKACGEVIVEDAIVMTVASLKRQYGDSCPHCKAQLSDWFKVRQETKEPEQ